MKIECQWKDKMSFTAKADQHQINMDAKSPIGSDTAMTPKQLLVASLCGCTALDVVALLKKHKQPLEKFLVEAEVVSTEGVQPATFKSIKLLFKATGAINPDTLLEAAQLSQSKFCGISAMLAKAVPISYEVELNKEKIGSGIAAF